jgi:hypothetical protein
MTPHEKAYLILILVCFVGYAIVLALMSASDWIEDRRKRDS